MIKLRIPAPEGLAEQLAIVDQAEQLVEGIPVEDPRWQGAYRALFVARDAADGIRRGDVLQPFVWPQRVDLVDDERECEGCGHVHYATVDCPEPGVDCGDWRCCERQQAYDLERGL